MVNLFAAVLVVLLADQGVKWALRQALGSRAVSLGRFGAVQLVEGRVWLVRLRAGSRVRVVWAVWLAAAAPLLLVSWWMPAVRPFVGLLLGGSLSHVLEHAVRGRVADYVCLRFWPAFNLADAAITVGAIGIVAHASGAVHAARAWT